MKPYNDFDFPMQGGLPAPHRKPKPRRWTLSTSELIVLLTLASASASVGTVWMFARALKAWGVIS